MASQFVTRNYQPFDFIHFTVRGHQRKTIFFTQSDQLEFLQALRDRIDGSHEEGRPRLLAYGQMPNHQHVLLRCGRDPLQAARLIRSVCTSYAIRFNRRHNTSGKVFQRPFRGRRIVGSDHLVNTFAYIHLNPDASLRIENSSHAVYAGLIDDPHIDPSFGWDLFGGAEGYLRFFEDTHRLRTARKSAARRLSATSH